MPRSSSPRPSSPRPASPRPAAPRSPSPRAPAPAPAKRAAPAAPAAPSGPVVPAAPALPAAFSLERAFTHRLHTLSKLTDRVSQAAYEADAGIPMSEGRCLAAVGAFGPLSVNELAQRANLDKAQASRAAQSLVGQGLVRKEASASDRRGVLLTLTPEGRRAWRRVMRVVERRNAQIVACLDARERRELDRLLDRLVAHAMRMAGAAPDEPSR